MYKRLERTISNLNYNRLNYIIITVSEFKLKIISDLTIVLALSFLL